MGSGEKSRQEPLHDELEPKRVDGEAALGCNAPETRFDGGFERGRGCE